MSDKPPNDDLLTFIAANVESLRDRIESMSDQMATKDDLALLREQMVTKDEFVPLREQVDYMGGQLESMRAQMATKGDIARLEAKIEVEVTTIRGDIEQVHLRLDSIEHALSARLGQIEAEVSRLRSVVYLLVKDRPELLRLLGQTPAPGGEGRL